MSGRDPIDVLREALDEAARLGFRQSAKLQRLVTAAREALAVLERQRGDWWDHAELDRMRDRAVAAEAALADHKEWLRLADATAGREHADRVAAEAALAEANREMEELRADKFVWKAGDLVRGNDNDSTQQYRTQEEWREQLAEANQQARDLADALRDIETYFATEYREGDKAYQAVIVARAALGRHTQADEA